MKKLFFSATLLLLVLVASGQAIENVKATISENIVTITYDIKGVNPRQLFNIKIYGSHNNFITPLRNVTGDVGDNVTSGTGKNVRWDATELGYYKGQMSFKVKGELIAMPFVLKNPVAGATIKRGKSTNLQWEGGTPGQNAKLEVYQGTNRIADIGETKNTGNYSWAIPKDFKKGRDYTLKISDAKYSATSGAFEVKAKVPLLLKLSPLLIGAVLIPFLSGGDQPEVTTPDTKLAAAPNPN